MGKIGFPLNLQILLLVYVEKPGFVNCFLLLYILLVQVPENKNLATLTLQHYVSGHLLSVA